MTTTWRSTEAQAARESAPCSDCFWTALSAISEADVPDEDAAWILARNWLYDRERISACAEHTGLVKD